MTTTTTAITTTTTTTTTIMTTISMPEDVSANRVRGHLARLEEHLSYMHFDNEAIRRLIYQVGTLIFYEEESLFKHFVVPLTALSLCLSIVLVSVAIHFPFLMEGYMITCLGITLVCIMITAIWTIPNYWMSDQLNLLSGKKNFFVQVFADLFLVIQFLRYLNYVLDNTSMYYPPGIIDILLLWGCVTMSMTAILAQRLNDESPIQQGPSNSIYDDVQDSLVVLSVPFLMLTFITLRGLTSAISRGSITFYRNAPIL